MVFYLTPKTLRLSWLKLLPKKIFQNNLKTFIRSMYTIITREYVYFNITFYFENKILDKTKKTLLKRSFPSYIIS